LLDIPEICIAESGSETRRSEAQALFDQHPSKRSWLSEGRAREAFDDVEYYQKMIDVTQR
jgi:hypothetical protein